MAHAEICPVCGSRGKICEELAINPIPTKICHSCSGKGWITVSDERQLPRIEGEYYPDYPEAMGSITFDMFSPSMKNSQFDGLALTPFEEYTSSGEDHTK